VQQREIEIGEAHRNPTTSLHVREKTRSADKRFQLLREMIDLGVRQRHEAPVFFPGAVVQFL